MTSVKEFRVDEPATATDLGRGSFVFTDDYSVFDWGKMPDEIPDKGASLCTMGAYNFQLLEANHVPTHYEGVRTDGDIMDLGEALAAGTPPEEMVISLTQVPDLPERDGEYDYDAYHADAGENYLIPLEIVFRNRVGTGSSLRRRTDPADHGLDFETWPDRVVELDEPIVEFSTKYEEQDRYLDREAADRIAGTASLDRLEELALAVDHIVTDTAAEADLVHEDGKIECLYHDGQVRVADVVGTFDENRFSYDGQQVSKEVIRQYHKRTQPEWVEAVGDAKERATAEGIADWKSLCDTSPESLDDDVIGAARDLYCAGTNAYVDGEVFDAPPLADAVDAVGDL
ncbi:phosphoribosylaminoimidazolesuccinocarboxamide synthase [Haloarcula salinisoli]|uniref:phosphoribosylaminoimidazolesuccinocarboxamide synthase n=1 Tax=Haloarcula salinisoli TaxID=2487746 RepID=A0A8J7YFD5_9EURY|nr:phosphoribosylaminoimidazolesuccinocarboxamide synthase [Halomicroarcula salinisoli]MBX0287356.1 phosphoribosylaminoimidazolesuccinocarboxamide synthase [Halomicroarcula salinisoli]MBX0305070.1 phosphoribosylaminoimidazolesuccinocarboxamide synthase [Halomicroarcula salinisoli]